MSSISPLGAVPAVGTSTQQAPRSPANPNTAAAPVPGASRDQGQSQAPGAPTPEQVKAAVDAANQALAQSDQELSFVFDDKLNRMLVKIVDKRTNTVIRQVPSEEMLAAARALSGSSPKGALLNSKA